MTGSQGTLVQQWGARTTVALAALVLLLHLAAAVLTTLLCPEMLRAAAFPGDHCTPHTSNTSYLVALDCEGSGHRTVGEGACLTRGEGSVVALADLRLSFRFPGEGEEAGQLLSAWNWRLVSSLGVHLTILAEDMPDLATTELELEVLLTASLDYAPLELLARSDPSGCLPSSPWHSLAIIRRQPRTIRCLLALPPQPRPNQRAELAFHCSLHPMFELSVISNSSYIVQAQVEEVPGGATLLSTNATVSSQLTVVRESREYHHLVFYIKCFFTPLLLASLVWFLVRLCINDFYVTIHDRLLITAGLAQVLANVPSEVLVAAFPEPFFRLLDPLAHIVLLTSLTLFWTVFILDKVATNEPWERTTRYYWKALAILLLAAAACLLGLLYLTLPSLTNPFTSHWQTATTTLASLAFTFLLAVTAASYQTYLSVITFRVICDISTHYPGSSRGLWRLKLVLGYCLLASLLVTLAAFLRLAVSLALHWNTEVHTDPLPFSVTSAGIVYLTELAGTNLHLVCLLVAVSRCPGSGGAGDWYTPVRPVMYSPARREEQLHLWDLSAQHSPLHKA